MQKQKYFRAALRLVACLIAVGVLAWAAPASAQVTWVNGQDLGSANGSYVPDGNNIAITAGGSDLWGTSDNGYFLYRQLAGDGTIIAKVESIVPADGSSTPNAWAKAGVMFRETLEAGSRDVYVVQTYGSGRSMQGRDNTGGDCWDNTTGGLVAPGWVKLVRKGNDFYGYRSDDGVTWTQQATRTVSMATNAYIGLCLTSHDGAIPVTAAYSEISIAEGSPPELTMDPAYSLGLLAPNSGLATKLIQVKNAGSIPLHLNSVTVGGADFALVDVKVDGVTTALPVTVNRTGAKVEIAVTYNATAEGAFMGQMVMGTDDPANPTSTII
ncbi:MAG TPA: hypothetical protein PKH31_14580, partial [Candidatus Sumerlaeota bacterium]|nr:hypothetical protein [Candidatus Sumerlaeota bacterium]